MKHKVLIRIILIVLIAIFLFAAFNMGKIYFEYKKADDTYREIQEEYVSVNNVEPTTETSTDEEELPPKVIEPPITVAFDALLKRNKDVVGWIYCPDTDVNYPVVQGSSNEQYLKKDIDGNYLVSGTLFADYRSGGLGEKANYVIFGHNMKNGTMFHMLVEYKDQSYYDQHPIMYYLTPDANYRLELFAGLVVKHNDPIYSSNQSREEFVRLINEYRAKSTFQSDVELGQDDMIITLSTCTYEFYNARYIVIGRLVPV